MPLGPAIGALIAGSANSVTPVMTPNNDFNAKLVNVRVMTMRPLVPVQVAAKSTTRRRRVFLPLAELCRRAPTSAVALRTSLVWAEADICRNTTLVVLPHATKGLEWNQVSLRALRMDHENSKTYVPPLFAPPEINECDHAVRTSGNLSC